MRLLVTGREGQLARSLAERAEGRGDIELLFAGRPGADLERPGAVGAAITEARPDIVINAAAFTNVDGAEKERERAFRINGAAAGEAARAAADVGAAILQLSTDYVFDGSAERPYREDDPTLPINVYGASKLAGEEAVRAANPRHLILRTSWLVGPYGRNFVKTMLRLAGERDAISVVDDQRGNPTSTLALADAILAVADRWEESGLGLGSTFHLAGAGSCSWAELAGEVMKESAAAGGPAATIVPIATSDYPTAARRPSCSALDSSRFEQAFGVPPEPWRPMVHDLVQRLAAP